MPPAHSGAVVDRTLAVAQSGIVDPLLDNSEFVLQMTLSVLRLVMFALALLITWISFQAYRQQQSERLELAFIGFAFVSMGTAVMVLSARTTQSGQFATVMNIAETVPFIVGFGTLYRSLYS